MLLPLLAMARLESRYSDFSIQSFFFSICLFMERRGKKFLRFMSPTHCFLHLSLDFFSFSLWLRPSCVTSYPYSVSISGWPYYISSVIPLTLPLPKYQLVLAYPLSQPRLVFSPVFMQNDPPPPRFFAGSSLPHTHPFQDCPSSVFNGLPLIFSSLSHLPPLWSSVPGSFIPDLPSLRWTLIIFRNHALPHHDMWCN